MVTSCYTFNARHAALQTQVMFSQQSVECCEGRKMRMDRGGTGEVIKCAGALLTLDSTLGSWVPLAGRATAVMHVGCPAVQAAATGQATTYMHAVFVNASSMLFRSAFQP